MKALSPEVSALLDKLYNLRGEDSVILVDMYKQKHKAEETKERTTEEKKELQEKIADLEQLNEALNDQGDKLVSVLSGIDRSEYAIVLDRLKIDFNPHALVEKINKSLPRTIDSVTLETKKAAEKLLKVEDEMNTAITTIDELAIRRDAALANQAKLNEYFELALTGSINITRDSITTLLAQFGFSEADQREAAKLLMFPEDALLIYEARLREKEKSGKSIIDVIAEAKGAEPVNEAALRMIDDEIPLEFDIEDEEEVEEETIEYEEEIDTSKEAVLEILQQNGLDYLDFSGKDLDYLIANFEPELMEKNIAYVNKIGVHPDLFLNHAGLMIDSELEDKFKILLDVGKEAIDIYLNPVLLEKYSKEDLIDAINDIKNNGMDPKNVPLMAY
ncbi:MAG: hypothetical protein HFJ02_01265 [Bacilli bacterium]|nr:hypothetical protein [Bacilli bacterium]